MPTLEEHNALINASEERIALLRRNQTQIRNDVLRTRHDVENAVRAWHAEHPVKTQQDLVREMAATDAARRQANKDAGYPVDYKGAPAATRSVIDQVARGGMGGDVNANYSRAFSRGAHPRQHQGRTIAPVDAARQGAKRPNDR